MAKSDSDKEVASAFFARRGRGKRRRRGNNWSRRKNGRYSNMSDVRKSAMSNYSVETKSRPRPLSVQSSESYESFYLGEKSCTLVEEPESTSVLRYKNGFLLNKRTRSVSRLLEQHIATFQDYQEDEEELQKCLENGCNFISDNLDELTQHKILNHKQLALFICYPCGKRFTTRLVLNLFCSL